MPKEQEYISYFQAVRNENKLLRQGKLAILENLGFKPDLDELEQLIAINDNVKNELFNKSITVVLKVDSVSGYVYIKGLPVYDEDEKIFVFDEEGKGFYPKSIKSILYGDGELRKEKPRQETMEPGKGKQYKPLDRTIFITQEQWENLGYWTAKVEGNTDFKYSLGADLTTSKKVYHCAKLVNEALLHIGYVNGLGGVFTREEIAKVSDEKYAIVFLLLPATERDLFNRCNLQHHDGDPNVCYKFTQQQIKLLEKQLQAGEKTFIRNAIQSLFDKVQELAEKDIAELPLPSPRMVNAAFAGFKLAYDLQNNFSSMFELLTTEVPKDEDLYGQASSMIARSHNLMDCAFAMGRMYNAKIAQQEQDKQYDSSSSRPKPNL